MKLTQNKTKYSENEYYFAPALCRAQRHNTECVNTRETLAILCWLRRGDQLGSRRYAKLFFSVFPSLFISHTLNPVPLSHKLTSYFSLPSHPVSSSEFLFLHHPLKPCYVHFTLGVIYCTLPPPLYASGDLNPPNILQCPRSLIRL